MRARRVRLTPRARGLVAAGIGLTALAIILRVGELYAVALAALVVPFVDLWRMRLIVGRVQLDASATLVPRRPEVGRPVAIRLTVRAAGRAMSAMSAMIVGVEAPFVRGVPRMLIPGVPRGASSILDLDDVAVRRGRYNLGPVTVALPDGLGLVDASWTVGAGREVLVLPAFTPLSDMPSLPADDSGTGGGRRSAQRGSEFHSLREYQRGDDLRQVHWRASAKHDALVIRETEPLAMPRMTVLLDDRSVSQRDDATMEWSVSAAASVLTGAGARGFGLRLITSDGRIGPARYGNAATDRLVERLAVVRRTVIGTLDAAISAAVDTGRGGALLAIVTSTLSREEVTALSGLQRRQGWAGVIMVTDPRDARADEVGGRLIAAGWKVVRVHPGRHKIEGTWKTLLERSAGRGLPARRSS